MVLPGIARDAGSDPSREAAVLGLFQHGGGRVALYGDSNCLDSSHQRTSCFEFLKPLLAWTAGVSCRRRNLWVEVWPRSRPGLTSVDCRRACSGMR